MVARALSPASHTLPAGSRLRRGSSALCLLPRRVAPDHRRHPIPAIVWLRRDARQSRLDAICRCATSAKAPIGTWQPPPILFNNARSHVVVARAAASSRKATCWRTGKSSFRISIANAPWPAAGHITCAANNCRMYSVLPRRFSPAAARMMASYSPGLEFAQARVHVSAQGVNINIGPEAFNCACRRRLLVPTLAPVRQLFDAAIFQEQNASRAILARRDRRNFKTRREFGRQDLSGL